LIGGRSRRGCCAILDLQREKRKGNGRGGKKMYWARIYRKREKKEALTEGEGEI